MGHCINEADFPASYLIDGIRMRVNIQYRSCGHKEAKKKSGKCHSCYPPDGTTVKSHGPYLIGIWSEQGKVNQRYIGVKLPEGAEKLNEWSW